MAYDEKLAGRIFDILKEKKGMTSQKMFGGLCLLHKGNMLCGIVDDKLMLRVGKEAYGKCIRLKYTQEMDFTGRPLKGMIYVVPEGLKTKAALSKWIDRAFEFVEALPAKNK